MWEYFLHLTASQDLTLSAAIATDFVYRWHVETLGKAFEIAGNRWSRIGWFAPLDTVTGDPNLPDGQYLFPLKYFESPQGLGFTDGVSLDQGVGAVHVELFTGVQLSLAIFHP